MGRHVAAPTPGTCRLERCERTLGDKSMCEKWRNLALQSLAELLAMGPWFSASAVVPLLTRAWALSSGEQS
ncbi:MAG: hypothetical protein ACK2UL_07600 [Anaerolineae bacterium]|jgi:hypothetical protein